MALPNPTPNAPGSRPLRQIDPQIEQAARHSGVPDISPYDPILDRVGPSNWYLLAAVLIAVAFMVALLGVFI